MTAPRPRLSDHLRVLALLVATVLGAIPFLLHLLVAPVATPIARRRLRRRLEEAGRAPPAPVEPPDPDPGSWAGRTVFVVAGEPSGDRLAARVVAAIRRLAPGVRVRGYAGPATAAAGADLDRSIVEHAVVGFFGVLGSLPTWWRLCARTLATFREEPPDVLLTVDFPGLNLRLARWARRRGIRTVHLVAPQTWAWAPWRAGRLRRAVDRLLVTFPFEEAVFRDAGVPASYVGHPLFEAPLAPPRTPASAPDPAGDPAATPPIELRPGSRSRDVRRQAPIVLEAAARVEERVPAARFTVRLGSPRAQEAFAEALGRARRRPARIETRADDGPAWAALSTSGTSTAELAVAQVPMVVFYRASMLGRLGAAALLTTPWFAMANLLCGREAVPERLVPRGGAPVLAEDLVALLTDRERWTSMRAALGEVRERLSLPDVAARCARAALAEDAVRTPAAATPAGREG